VHEVQLDVRFQVTFRGITRTIFARLRKQAMQNGIPIGRPAGEAVQDGVRIQWKYDPDAEMLEVECVKTPFWIDAARVNQRLSLEVQATLESDRTA
jgi:hypothetical protein